jgi:hypothetical protein
MADNRTVVAPSKGSLCKLPDGSAQSPASNSDTGTVKPSSSRD